MTPPGHMDEKRRRDRVIQYDMIPLPRPVLTTSSELEGIEGQLLSLSVEPGFQCLLNHTQHSEDVSRLLEDLREAIFRYQVCS